MGIYVKINGIIAKGYEVDMLNEVIERLKNGEKSFKIKYPYGQGEIEVTTD